MLGFLPDESYFFQEEGRKGRRQREGGREGDREREGGWREVRRGERREGGRE